MTARDEERRVERLEDRAAAHDEQLRSLAPAAAHIAEIGVQYTWIKESLDRIENKRLDPIHIRLRRVEYAVIALVVAFGSPKLGVPSIPQVAQTVTGLFA